MYKRYLPPAWEHLNVDRPWWRFIHIYTRDDGTAFALDADTIEERDFPTLAAAIQWAREYAVEMGVEESEF